MKFIASRLSEGNKIFPAEIYIEENGIKVKIPGFLSGDTKFIDYVNISAVDINTPMIGFSSLTFFYQGNQAYAHGFKKEEAQQIKQAIDRGKAKAKVTTINHNYVMPNPVSQQTVTPVENRVSEPSSYSEPVNTVNSAPPVSSKSSNNMYSDQLETLIEFALADGELTEKERQILGKKAQAEGIDPDEFEMVLEARLYQNKKLSNNVPASNIHRPEPVLAQLKSDKLGDNRKCPSCGASAQSYSTRCPDCGHDFTNLESSNSINAFFKEYQLLENNVVLNQDKNNGVLGKLVGNIGNLGGGDWKRAVFTKKKEFIMHFPIPNSKEDILEFLTMAVPLASPAKKTKFSGIKKFGAHFGDDHAKNYDFMIAEVWMQKCEQLIMKSKFAMKDDKKSLQEVEYYANQLGIN
jgi:hypothetical protein